MDKLKEHIVPLSLGAGTLLLSTFLFWQFRPIGAILVLAVGGLISLATAGKLSSILSLFGLKL